MLKKAVIGIVVLIVIVAGIIFYFGQEIFQYSAEKIIKENLPPYVMVDRILFNLEEGKLEVTGLRIKNPRGYQDKFLARIELVTCKYGMKGKNILDGIEVTEISARAPVINIERLADGRLNVNEMGQLMVPSAAAEPRVEKEGKKQVEKEGKKQLDISKKISDLIKLTDTINISHGTVVFKDAVVSRPPYKLTFDDLNGKLVLKLNKDYTEVLSVSSQGAGIINRAPAQGVSWTISFDPTASALTMSSRFEIQNVDITQFRPYYDPYSPIVIYNGLCSGTLVFDFDHGNIGSMNTLVIRGLRFALKKGGAGTSSWQAEMIPEVIRYLQSNPDEITFDFKIKGTMQNPRFYPGDHVKRAIQAMTVDKVSDVIRSMTQEGGQAPGAPKSDAGKVIDIMQKLLKR